MAKSGSGENSQHRKNHEHNQLSDLKRRLRLRGGQGFERRHPAEKLHYQDEEIQIQRKDRADGVGFFQPVARCWRTRMATARITKETAPTT